MLMLLFISRRRKSAGVNKTVSYPVHSNVYYVLPATSTVSYVENSARLSRRIFGESFRVRHGVAADISVASEEGRLFVSTPVEDAGEDDGSLLASMGILFFGTMRHILTFCTLHAHSPCSRWHGWCVDSF
jgi:hypothetical protein